MKRLTIRNSDGTVSQPTHSTFENVFNRLAEYEDTGLEPEEILTGKELAEVACALISLKEYKSLGTIDHIRELLKAEQDGRLVVMPCNVGDTVYCITECDCENIDGIYTQCEFYGYGTDDLICTRLSGTKCPYQYRVSEQRATEISMFWLVRWWGKIAFATREEAEAAIAKKGDDD